MFIQITSTSLPIFGNISLKTCDLDIVLIGVIFIKINLRFALETCKVCNKADCSQDSLVIIEKACSDSLQLWCFDMTNGLIPFIVLRGFN